MSYTKIQDALWDVRTAIYKVLGNTIATDRALDALQWYIATGRASTEFLAAFCDTSKRQKTTIAKRLIEGASKSTEDAIKSVKQYLKIA